MPDKIVLVNNFGEQSENTLLVDLGANGKKITNLADPTSDQEAATKKYVDTHGGGGGSAVILDHTITFSSDIHVVSPASVVLRMVKQDKIVNVYFNGLNIEFTGSTQQVFADASTNLPNGWIPNINPDDGGVIFFNALPNGAIGFFYIDESGNFSIGNQADVLPTGAPIYLPAQCFTFQLT